MGLAELKQHLKENKFAPLYVFGGTEDYLKRHYLNMLIEKLAPLRDFNYIHFEGKEMNPEELEAAVESLPVMAEMKLIVVSDFDPDGKGDAWIYVERIIKNIPEYCVIVFYYSTMAPDMRKSHAKALKHAANAVKGDVEFDISDKNELIAWIKRHVKSQGKQIDDAAVNYLLEISDYSMSALKSEIDKLCAYAYEGMISKRHVNEIVIKTADAKSYELGSAINECDFDRALFLISELTEQKYEMIMISSVIFKAITDSYRLKLAAASGRFAEAAKEAGIRDFVARRYSEWALKTDVRYYRTVIKLCAKIDMELKSSRADKRVILEKLIGNMKEVYLMYMQGAKRE